MNLYWTCTNCTEENKKSSFYSTRVEVAMREGETQELKCKSCNKTSSVSVDELTAKKSNLAVIVASIIGVVGTGLMFYIFFYFVNDFSTSYSLYAVGGYLVVPIVAYQLILAQDQQRVNSFNRHKFK